MVKTLSLTLAAALVACLSNPNSSSLPSNSSGGVPPTPTTVYKPFEPFTPLDGGTTPGTLTVNEGANFDIIVTTTDVDKFQKFFGGVEIEIVAIGNPDGDPSRMGVESGQVNAGTLVSVVKNSTSGGTKTYTFNYDARTISVPKAEKEFLACVENFQVNDSSGEDPLDTPPWHLVFDNNVPVFGKGVRVTNNSD